MISICGGILVSAVKPKASLIYCWPSLSFSLINPKDANRCSIGSQNGLVCFTIPLFNTPQTLLHQAAMGLTLLPLYNMHCTCVMMRKKSRLRFSKLFIFVTIDFWIQSYLIAFITFYLMQSSWWPKCLRSLQLMFTERGRYVNDWIPTTTKKYIVYEMIGSYNNTSFKCTYR